MNILEHILDEAEGTEKPFAVELLTDGVVTIKKYFQTRRLAWAYGENWKMLSGHYDYRICEPILSA